MEVKPIIHVLANIDDEAGNSSLQPTGKTATCDFHFVECCSSCYQIYSVSGKICAALVSVTKDLATKICFTDKSELSPVGQMRIIIKFCIFSINKILVDHCFCWDNLTVNFLRNYPLVYDLVLLKVIVAWDSKIKFLLCSI